MAEAPARRRKSWGIRIGLVLLSALLAEGGLRLVLSIQGRPYDSGAAAESLRRGLDRFGGQAFEDLLRTDKDQEGRLPHPFYAWETGGGLQQIDDHYRALQDGATDDFEVWIVGGSVAEIFGQPDQGADRLAERLKADARFAGRDVAVHDYARSSFKQPQQVMLFSYLLSLGLAPDVLINLDGFNEVAIGMSNARSGSHPSYPSLPMWGALQIDPESDSRLSERLERMSAMRDRADGITHRVLASGLQRSCIVGSGALAYLSRSQERWMSLAREYATELQRQGGRTMLRGPELGAWQEELPRVIVANWVECSRTLKAICAERSIAYLHVLQPTLHDENSKRPTAKEEALVPLNETWLEGVQVGYPLLRAAAAELREHGIDFLDASLIFADVTETLYIDPIHFGSAGNRILADRIATALLTD